MSRIFLGAWKRGRKILPKQAELDRWDLGYRITVKTLLRKSKEHVCPPPFSKVELPLSNLSGGDTGGCSWGLDLQRNSSPEACGKPRMAGGKVERGKQQDIHERYQKTSGWGKISWFTTDADPISKGRGSSVLPAGAVRTVAVFPAGDRPWSQSSLEHCHLALGTLNAVSIYNIGCNFAVE